MRSPFIVLFITSFLFACTDKEDRNLNLELKELSDPVEVFTFTNDKLITITTKNGTSVTIPPGALVTADGQEAKGLVKVEIKDVFDKSQMILNGLSTVSDGRLLESFGMVWLNATSDDKKLSIKNKKSLTVSFPNKRKGRSGELFYGVENDSLFNWTYAGAKKDTTEVTESYTILSDNLISIKRTTYKIQNGLRVFVSDSIFTERVIGDVAAENVDEFPPTYDFEIKNLGWINCDRFLEFKDVSDVEVSLANFSQPIGYFIFSEVNSVMQIYFDSKGHSTVRGLPNTAIIDIIIIDKIKDQYVWSVRNHKIVKENRLTIETKPISEEQLKIELRKLDK